MPLKYNSERGEVPLTVGGVDLVIAAEMKGIAAVSNRMDCKSFAELFVKLVSGEPNAVIAGIECLSVQGDWGAAIKAMTIKDLGPCISAFKAAMLHHSETPTGKRRAVKGKRQTQKSLGGDGSARPA